MKGKFQLTFECSEDWNSMSPAANGRHCANCNKTVIDFTQLTPAEIRAHAHKKDLCARFYEGQLNPSLIKPIENARPVKLFLLLSMLSLSISGKDTPGKLPAKHLTEHYTGKNQGEITTVTSSEDHMDLRNFLKPKNRKPVFQTKKKLFYWSKRFPFIVGVKKYVSRQGSVRFLED